MYSQYDDTQYPHGQELGPVRGQITVDPSGSPARYPFMPYYGSKGPDSAQLAAAMSQRISYCGEFGGMGNPEAMYNQGWNSMMAGQGYMGPHVGKPGPYGMQGMGAYPALGYPGPPHHPYSSGGQYSHYGSSQSLMPAGHPAIMQQHSMPGHRFTPPTGSSASSRPAGVVEGSPYQGGIPGSLLPPGAGSGSPGPPWPLQVLPQGGGGGGNRGYGEGQSSPAPPTSGSGGGAWPPSYHSSEYPSGGPSTPNSAQGPPPSSSNPSKLKMQDKQGKTPQGSSLPLSQKQQMDLLSPHNSELPKTQSISSLRDALLATTPTSSASQQYASYNSPKVGEHQGSPMTPSTNIPITPESNAVISPRMNVVAASRQDSQLSSGGQSVDQELAQSYSRQNSVMSGVEGGGNNPSQPEEDSNRVSPLQVESILGIKNDQPIDPILVGVQQSSPLSGSVRDGGGGGVGSALNSPHTQTPLGSALNPNIVVGMQDGRSPAPGRPEILGFPARSPSFRSTGENQPSPLTEDGKTARKIMSPVDRSHPSITSQYDGDQKRKDFLDSLFNYLEKEGIQLVRLPLICKAPFDLYQIFNSVQQHGGFISVMEKRLWRDVIKTAYGGANNPTSSSLRTVQQYYAKLLLPYESHVNNVDISTCLSKLDNSMYRHTSLGSPCSQLSSDGECKDRVNHLSDMSKFDSSNSVEGRVNGETSCVVPGAALMDGEHVVERISSQGSVGGNEVHQNSTNVGPSSLRKDEPPAPPKVINLHNHEEGNRLGFSDESQNSVETYSQAALAEPLPEMSVQDAESVLGMSPTPYPNQEGPTTPSAGVPSPHFSQSSHYQQQQQQQQQQHGGPQPRTPGSVGTPTGGRVGAAGRGGSSHDYNMEMGDMGGASTPGLSGGGGTGGGGGTSGGSNSTPTPPAYPPPYPMDMPGYHTSYGPSNYPPYNSHSFHRQYDMSPDFHPGMSSPMIRSPYPPSNRSPYSGMSPIGPHRTPMDYHRYHHHPHLMHQMSGMRDISSYHGMSPSEWHWQQQQQQQQRQQMISSLPPHIQQYQRMQQQQQAMNAIRHQQQQQAAMAAMQHSTSRGSSGLPSGGPNMSALDHSKMQWQDQNHPHKIHSSKVHNEKVSSSPKPQFRHSESETKVKNSDMLLSSDSSKRIRPNWTNCVEGAKPQLVKRRKLYGFNCGHVEPWRLMMSLKSGILADSTWALDTLTILLHDETTYGYFNLKHHHSLLNTIVGHFKVTLSAVFNIDFEDAQKYYSGREGNVLAKGKGEEECNITTESLMEASRSDSDVLMGPCGEENCEEPLERSQDEGNGLSIPIANVYDSKLMKLGKSDDLSHISIPSIDDEYFPQEDVHLEIMPESERLKLDQESLLQRVDQTPVSVLLQREALLTQIPLHRFGRLSHSPRRRERNFFGDIRRRESLTNVDEEQSSMTGNTNSGKKEMANKRESICKSPIDLILAKKSTSNSPSKKDPAVSPILREESEAHRKEELPLWSVSPVNEQLESRCKCLSNILRSLTFVPGNDVEFCQHPGILIILGKLLMLHHHHLIHSKDKKHFSSSLSPIATHLDDNDTTDTDSTFDVRKVEDQQFPPAKDYWWWHCLDTLREDTLVILANISGQLDLSVFPEKISFPIINGLLHWLVCPSSVALDPLPDPSKVYSQSPQRLVVETLAKMTISEVNVDLILATPPLMRLDLLFSQLGQMIGQKKHPVVRQFALVLLSNLAQGNEYSSRLIGQQKMVMSLLLECLEMAEHLTCMGQGSMEGGYGKEDPSSLSVAMLRRAATTLHYLSRVPANRTAFLPYRDRILYLATSQYVEPSVSSILMDMLYEFGKL